MTSESWKLPKLAKTPKSADAFANPLEPDVH